MYKSAQAAEYELLEATSPQQHPSTSYTLFSQDLLDQHARRHGLDETSLTVSHDVVTTGNREKSKLISYSPFTKEGRRLLYSKITSSGSANINEKSTSRSAHDESSVVQRSAGWRRGTWACCFAVIACIVIELVLLIWAVKSSIGGDGSGLLYEGSCDRAKDLAIWLLFPLNIAATILIGTSNYVMQITTAPSRSEIDRSHQFGKAITISGMSFGISASGRDGRVRRTIWWLLILSSLPIHLLLNSAIYSSVQASDNGVLVVSEGFESETPWVNCTTDLMKSSPSSNFTCHALQYFQDGQTTKLSRTQCISQYATGFQTNASSVIVVVAADAGSWHHPPDRQSAVRVPSSYGLACNQSKSGYTLVPESDRNYMFSYDQALGNSNVTIPFLTGCTNRTDTQRNSWSIEPGRTFMYESSREFFYSTGDALANITSVRSVFSAIKYRYWATAQVTGDYLNANYQTLSKGWDARSWLCSGDDLARGLQCDPTKLLASSEWKITPSALSVSHCHVFPKEERCTVRYSWRILVITICCDVVKLIAMISTLNYITKPLATLGDVIASFLQNPDPYTQGRCLLDDHKAMKWVDLWEKKRHALVGYPRNMPLQRGKRLRKREPNWATYSIPVPLPQSTEVMLFGEDSRQWLLEGGSWWVQQEPVARPEVWAPHHKRWSIVPSRARWAFLVLLYTGLCISASLYLTSGLKALRQRQLSNIWTAGFNGPDPNALFVGSILSSNSNITWAAILVNMPQVFFSMLYFVFNAMFTLMHTGQEWADFTRRRKALRVSSPRGQQRSTYWLQLPWKYSIPLVIMSGSLHWLLGRSVYLVKVEIYGYFGERQADDDFFACGYNSITSLTLIVLLGLMLLSLLAIAMRRLTPGSPLVRFNSLAVAAACHPDPSEKDVALQPLMWGVLRDEQGLDTQHCSFSAREVSPLQEGALYS